MSMFYELMMKKRGIPSRYQEVEYIESTGTQYIDTGYEAKTNTIFEVDCAFTDLSAGRNGYLQNAGGNVYRYYFGVLNSKFVGANNTTYNHSIQDADTQRHIFAIKQDGIYIDDTKVYSSNALYGSINIYLFVTNVPDAVDGKNYYCKQKVYNSKIYDNNRLLRNFIPVYDTLTQKYGMWESVQGKFYGNNGTGNFKGSIVGYTIVGSPTITDGVVSGFSSANYLTLSGGVSIDKDFEWVFKIHTPSSTATDQRIIAYNCGTLCSVYLSGQNQYLRWWINRDADSTNHQINSNVALALDTDYYIKASHKNGKYELSYSTDDINYTVVGSATFVPTGNTTSVYTDIGVNHTSYYSPFLGAIDIPNCYMIIDGKLWFNGQQA